MQWQVYLSGEIHTDWREQIIEGCKAADSIFTLLQPSPTTMPVMRQAITLAAKKNPSGGITDQQR